jgi:hypothetical protein
LAPSPALPAWSERLAGLFEPARAAWQELGSYRGRPVKLLNLALDPETQTTKIFASLLIVARALEHIRLTGESLLIVSPTSGNKGVALRRAVGRAITLGLARPGELRVVTISPAAARYKLRADTLSADPVTSGLNPMLTTADDRPEGVKALGRAFAEKYADDLWRGRRIRLWYTLDLANYIVADVARAFFEERVDPVGGGSAPRVHVQAVSSAFGLLGYHLGRDMLEEGGGSPGAARPRTLLVQHMSTPDMVLHLLHGSFDRANIPRYREVFGGGPLGQGTDPHFPYVAGAAREVVDPTFYSARPATADAMSQLVRRHGGDGIVVSRADCLSWYPYLRGTLTQSGFTAPADASQVREWSLVMAFAGALNAIDRELIPPDCEVVVHGTGWYTAADYRPVSSAARMVASPQDVLDAVTGIGAG